MTETIKMVIGHFYGDNTNTVNEIVNLFETNGYEVAFENGTTLNFSVIKEVEIELPPEE